MQEFTVFCALKRPIVSTNAFNFSSYGTFSVVLCFVPGRASRRRRCLHRASVRDVKQPIKHYTQIPGKPNEMSKEEDHMGRKDGRTASDKIIAAASSRNLSNSQNKSPHFLTVIASDSFFLE
jgi:hypothetical protein